jgi:virginiamycin B lyase
MRAISAGIFLCLAASGALAQGTIPGLTSTPITFSGHADDFAAGPDGNVWLVDSTANAIGRLAVDGSAYQAFPVPTAGAGLNSIVAGPDGNLWFTESSVSKVGRITTSGAITEFAVPAAFVYVLFGFVNGEGTIAAGPDGNLWISGSGQMAKVTPQGAVTVLSVAPPPGGDLFEIGKCVAGPDANLWCLSSVRIAGEFDNHPVKVTTAGVATLYPGFFGQYFDILSAPDGNLWISAQGTSPSPPESLTRVTPAGVETLYTLPTTRESRLAAGADGNIWFTERTTMGNLWQLVLSTATDDGHATFNNSPITTDYPEGIIAVTSPAGASGIHAENTSATGCPPGVEFEIVTSADYGANITRVKTSAPDKCTHIYARAEIERHGDVAAKVKVLCAVSGNSPNAAAHPKLVLKAPAPALTSMSLKKGGWTDCEIDVSGSRLECLLDGELPKGQSLEEEGPVGFVVGLFNVTCTSDTPQIAPSPDDFDFALRLGIPLPLSQDTVDKTERSHP